jgi:DNA-binding SARP family transcriptional activator/tetratricopeptide (TPR) repeat protein
VVPLRVGVLGPVIVWRDGREQAAGQPRQLAVLGVLATRANRVVSRGELVDAVWGDQPPASAEGGIYTYVAGLRRVIEPDRPRRDPDRSRQAPARTLVSGGGGYLLRLAVGAFDADHFERCLASARGLRADYDPAGALRAVDEALALWRGLPYAGVPGPFAEAEQRRLTELRTTAMEERAELMLAQGQAAAAVPELTALTAAHPLREQATGLLMIALYRCGRQAEALRVFGETRKRLAEDLGVDPGSELTRIHRQLLAMDPALDGPATARPAAIGSIAGDPPVGAAGGFGSVPAPSTTSATTAAPASPAPPPAPPPAQLPPEVAGFAGRTAELHWLHGLLPGAQAGDPVAAQADDPAGDPAADQAGSPVALITGTAGIGKTTLAIRFAREAASRFPDGQLYVNLRGFDPASGPLPPTAALQGFFDALGVSPRHVPAGLDAQSALLRTLLDGKRLLLLLDNAHDANQVRPLLPGSPGCLAVVTSRSQLTGLVVADGARPLPLDVLDDVEAAELLARRLGAERVNAEPEATAALVERTAGLPLALSVTCARAACRPGAALADVAAELADARGRLDALRTGEAATDLRAVFSWSVDKLSESAARAFRLLSLHPGPDITAAAAASLIAATPAAARAALAELVRASLLTEDAAGRFGCHDLLRAYAVELTARADGESEQDAARQRVADHYLRTAQAAASRLFPARGEVPLPPAAPGVTAEDFGGPADADGNCDAGGDADASDASDSSDRAYEAALAWFWAEQRVLRGVLELAAAHGLDQHCWKLAWYWAPKLKRRGRLHEVLKVQRMALTAADRLGDTDALAHVHYDLGHVSGRLRDYQAADLHLRRALELFEELGDRAGVGQAQHGLALLLSQQDRNAEALEHGVEALRLRRAFADSAAVAYSENMVGWIRAHLGGYEEALVHCRRALELHRESGSRSGVADTLDSIAFIYGGLADYPRAIDHYEQALAMYQHIGDPEGEAGSLLHLGDVQLAEGLSRAARRSWERALALLGRIPGADASEATFRLACRSADGSIAS